MKPALIGLIVFLLLATPAVAYYLWYSRLSESQKRDLAHRRETRELLERDRAVSRGKLVDKRRISRVGTRTAGGALSCPQCGGTQFKEKRSRGGKLLAGGAGVAVAGPLGAAGALAARKKRVRCVTCGTEYIRG